MMKNDRKNCILHNLEWVNLLESIVNENRLSQKSYLFRKTNLIKSAKIHEKWHFCKGRSSYVV